MITGTFIPQDCDKINCRRLSASKYKEKYSTKKKRTKIVRGKAKQKDDKNEFKKGQIDTAAAF